MNTLIICFLLKLKNAALYKKEIMTLNYKQEYIPILKALYIEGYIQSFFIKKSNNQFFLTIYLRMLYNYFPLSNLKLISKLSIYKTISYRQLASNIYDIKKTLFISTNKGVKTQILCKQNKLGGKLLFMC